MKTLIKPLFTMLAALASVLVYGLQAQFDSNNANKPAMCHFDPNYAITITFLALNP